MGAGVRDGAAGIAREIRYAGLHDTVVGTYPLPTRLGDRRGRRQWRLVNSSRVIQCMRRRVVITGIGCVNPMGHDVETVWQALKEGQSGVGYTTIFDASKFPTQDLGRGQGLGHRRQSAKIPSCGSTAAGTPSSPPAPPSRRSTRRASWTRELDPDAVRRLSRQRRRAARISSRFTQMMAAALEGDELDLHRVHQGGPGDPQPDRRNWSRSRTCRPATWPACSTPRAPTSTA